MSQRIRTAEDIAALSPAQRHELFEASIVTDLDNAPSDLLARTRKRVEALISANEQPPQT